MSDVEIIDNLFFYFLIVATIIFAAVVFFIFYSLIKFRAKKNPCLPSQKERSERLEWILGTLATVITGIFLYLSIVAMNKIQSIPKSYKPFMEITGHQWWWEAKYTDSGAITANQIYIPTGKRILLKLTAADVIHSWWVPELGRKMDMIPGVTNYVWCYAEKEGEYLGSCSEFCGAQHARMRIRVIALNDEDYKVWTRNQLKPAVNAGDSLFMKGKQLFEQKTCTECHAINGTSYTANIGPNLTHFASRKRFLGDMLDNNEENLRAWLKDPQKVKEGSRMPNFIFNDEELDALVTYIHNLK